MPKTNFSGASALLTHLLEGHLVSQLEAMMLFGVQNPASELTRLRKAGHFIHKRRVPMAKILRRMNQLCTALPPQELPIREIAMTEYWISK